MKKSHNHDIVYFFHDYERYTNAITLGERIDTFKHIIDTYVKKNGKYALNLDNSLYDKMISVELSDIMKSDVGSYKKDPLYVDPKDPIAPLVHSQKSTLQHFIFPNFVRSNEFIKYIKRHDSIVDKIGKERLFSKLNLNNITDINYNRDIFTDLEIKFIQSISSDSYLWTA
jgi:hypothetical protein